MAGDRILDAAEIERLAEIFEGTRTIRRTRPGAGRLVGVRLTRLPKGAKVAGAEPTPGDSAPVARRRRPPMRGTWRCCGVTGCGETLRDVTWAAMERHLAAHGGGRAEAADE